MRLTEDIIEAGQSRNGGWSERQLALLGVAWPPGAGWKRDAIGREVPNPAVEEFLALKDAHLPQESPSLFDTADGEG